MRRASESSRPRARRRCAALAVGFEAATQATIEQPLRLDPTLTPTDCFSFDYGFVQADQADSPVKYGHAGCLDCVGKPVSLVSGFPRRDLAQALYAEYRRVLTANLLVTAGLAAALPQSGVETALAGAQAWYGALVDIKLRD